MITVDQVCTTIQVELNKEELPFNSPHRQIHNIKTWGFDPENPNAKPVIWVIHGLTGNDDPFDWWPGIFNSESKFAKGDFAILSVCLPNSTYSSCTPKIGDFQLPITIDELEKWKLSTSNVATIYFAIKERLKIQSIHYLIGASLGGQVSLKFALLIGNQLEKLALITTNAKHSAWGQAFNHCQRLALELDPNFLQNPFDLGKQGLSLARSIAMISYRTYTQYEATQSSSDHSHSPLQVESYLDYQGKKLGERFSAIHYWLLSKMMDSHQLAESRNDTENLLQQITAETIVISFDSDILFPENESEFLAEHIPNSTHFSFHSDYGHDAFLVENDLMKSALF